MSVEHMPDERLSHFYENIRQQSRLIARTSINSWPAQQRFRCSPERWPPPRPGCTQRLRRDLAYFGQPVDPFLTR
jgi:hypothetical protein